MHPYFHRLSRETVIVRFKQYLSSDPCYEIIKFSKAMEHEILHPEPPKVSTPETPKPPQPERPGLFERWLSKDKKPEAPETPEKPKRVRKKMGEFIFSMFAENPPEKAEQASAPTSETSPETPDKLEVIDRASRARRFARLVLSRVMTTARSERVQAEPLSTEGLQNAAEDLQEADQELGETLQETTTRSAEADGMHDTTAEFEAAPEVSTAARIVERVSQLERSAERSRAQAIAAVGLGVIAVLVAGHEYLGRKHTEKKNKVLQREVIDQRQTLAQQEAEFARLRQNRQQVAAMDRPERQAYYDRLSQFTHSQAEVTRDITREVQQRADNQPELQLPRTSEQSQPSSAERQPLPAPESALRPEPLARVETADRVELGPSKSDRSGTQFIGGSAAGGIPGAPVEGEEDIIKAPLSEVARRQKALQDARLERFRSNAWMYGVAFAGVLVIIAALLIFG